MKKKMIIYMSKMSVGGMERSLLNLLEQSNYTKNYEVTVYMLYSKEKTYLEKLNNMVDVKLLWKYNWNILGKLVCGLKMTFDLFKLFFSKNKWDVSICYPYQHPILAKLTLKSSKNNIIFIHNDLELKYGENLSKHCKKMNFDKFSKIICVSNKVLESFKNIYPKYKGTAITINNYINGTEIIRKSKIKTKDFNLSKELVTFINIARHEEKSKGISKIIKASNKLKKDRYKFRVLLVGDGESHNYYSSLIKKFNLEDYVYMVGNTTNPYAYLKISDCFVFSSNYEGYGIVLDEARVLNVPIITTNVADAKLIVDEGYGILCDNNEEGVYMAMKKYLDEGFSINKKFDYVKFNNNITKLLDKIAK